MRQFLLRSKTLFSLVFMTLGMVLSQSSLMAQMTISQLGVAVTQDFSTLDTFSVATLPIGWRGGTNSGWTSAATVTTRSAGTIAPGTILGSTSSGSFYNFANGSNSTLSGDRALGFLGSGSFTSPRNLFFAFTNNTGSSISSLTIAWDYEKYRSGSRAFNWSFFHGSDTLPSIPDSSGFHSYAADAGNTVVNNPPISVGKSFTISNLNIAPGGTYFLRWVYAGVGGNTNAQALGIDNFSLILNAGGGGPAATLSLGALASNTVCAIGGSPAPITVTYTSTGSLSGPVDLQLSDATGSFANPSVLGSGIGSSGTITTIWPSTLAAGSAYLLRLVSGTVTSASSAPISVLTSVPEATSLAAVPSNGVVTLTWTNPTRCFDQALVVADTALITALPSGNIFLTNTVFGQGAQVGTGYAVFAASGNSVTVTGLTNGTTYHFKVFVQSGNTWSAGISTQSIPFSTQSFPLRSIASVIGVNSLGVLDSLGARVRLTGTIYGINQYSSSTTPAGVQYVMMDQSGGIMFRRAGTNFGYSGGAALVQGDSVELIGVLEQYNGLTQVNCDTVIRLATGRTLASPTVVTALDETTENRLVRLNGLVLVGSTWPTGPITSGVNVNVSNGASTFELRILPTTNIPGNPAPNGYFDLIGLGQQFDNTVPLTSGYQITPRYMADIIAVPLVNTVANFSRNDTLVSNQSGAIGMNISILNPNPVAQVLKVRVNTSAGAAYGVTYETFPVPVNDTITLNVPANATSAAFSVLLYPAVPSGRTDTLGFTLTGASLGISAGIVNYSSIRVQTLSIPTYSIGLLRGNNVSGTVVGIPDSNGVYAKTTGIVLGGNRRVLPSPGLEFFIFDPVSNAGIGVFRTSNFSTAPYQVTEGDLVRVIGRVTHFNGLAQFTADSIVVISSGNALPAPQVVTAMNENTESRLIRIDNLTLVPATPNSTGDWPVSGATGSGRTPRATNGVDTFDIRIDNDVNLFNSPAPTGLFSMIGVGSQFDATAPHSSGYQLCPRYLADLVQVVTYSVSGILTYNNTASTPMTNSVVRIKDGLGAVVASDSTDALGAYAMSAVPSGTYTLEAITSKPWGGVTASDALGISRHFSGSVPLTGLRLSAADVNGSTSITSGDALLVNRRFSGSLSAFTVGNWLSERPALNVVSGNVTQDLKMLAFGDVNGSYAPNTALRGSASALGLIQGAEASEFNGLTGQVKVTLRADRAMELGSVSLELPLPAGVQVVGMEPGNLQGHYSWGQREGMWCYGWFDASGMKLNENDAVVTLTLKADRAELLAQLNWTALRLGGLTAMTDVWGQELAGNLRVPSFKSSNNAISIFPNPSAGDLQVSWGSSSQTPTKVLVRDLTGRVVTEVSPVQGTQTLRMDLQAVPAGNYSVELLWNAAEGIARIERSTLVVRP